MPEQKIKCPLCFRELMVQTEWAGRIIQCPLCQGTIRLPEFQDSPAAPSYQPQAEVDCGDQTEYDETPDGDKEKETLIQSLGDLASGIALVLLLFGNIFPFILYGRDGLLICRCRGGLIEVGIVLLILSFMVKKRVNFVLQPGEKIIFAYRLKHIGTGTGFIRITNKRAVLCEVEYPLALFLATIAMLVMVFVIWFCGVNYFWLRCSGII